MKIITNLLSIIALLVFAIACSKEEDPDLGDKTSPTIVSITPEDGATDVSVMTDITVSFSENLDAVSVTQAFFSLSTSTSSVTGSFDVSNSSVTFRPSSDLDYATEYTLVIGAGITDQAGNRLSGSRTVSFTTEGQPDTEAPQVLTVNPDNGATDVALDSEITITFSEAIDLGSVNDNTVSLIPSGTTNKVESAVTISNSTMTIAPTTNLSAGTTYEITLSKELTDLSGNGLDAVFTSSFSTDAIPTVASTMPDSNATGVSVNGSFEITFSEEMNESTISFRFSYSGGFTEQGSIVKQGSIITITPTHNLLQDTDYSLTVSGEDLAGNAMESSYKLDFKTAPANLEVLSVTPNEAATDVAISSSVTIEFASNVRSQSVNSSTIKLVKNGTDEVFGLFSVNGAEVVFTPNDPLTEFKTAYEVVIGTGVQASNGGFVANEMTYSFTTEQVSSEYYYHVKRASQTNIVMIAKLDQEGVVFPGNDANTNQQKWYFEKAGTFRFRIWNKHFSTRSLDYTEGILSRVGIKENSPRYWELTRSSTSESSYYFSIPGTPTVYFNINTFETQSTSVSGAENAWILERVEKRQ